MCVLNEKNHCFGEGKGRVMGDSLSTWTNGTTYWPNLLTKDKDFDGTSVLRVQQDLPCCALGR